MADKLKNPRILRIIFYTLRHFKGTPQNVKNTLLYVHLAEQLFKDHQEFVSKVAKTEEDACELVEASFDYICDFDGAKLFRKSKHYRLDTPRIFAYHGAGVGGGI